MLQLFPFAAVSAIHVVLFWKDEGASVQLLLLTAWFVVAFYLQFLAGSGLMNAIGLAVQTALAIFLTAWFRLDA